MKNSIIYVVITLLIGGYLQAQGTKLSYHPMGLNTELKMRKTRVLFTPFSYWLIFPSPSQISVGNNQNSNLSIKSRIKSTASSLDNFDLKKFAEDKIPANIKFGPGIIIYRPAKKIDFVVNAQVNFKQKIILSTDTIFHNSIALSPNFHLRIKPMNDVTRSTNWFIALGAGYDYNFRYRQRDIAGNTLSKDVTNLNNGFSAITGLGINIVPGASGYHNGTSVQATKGAFASVAFLYVHDLYTYFNTDYSNGAYADWKTKTGYFAISLTIRGNTSITTYK